MLLQEDLCACGFFYKTIGVYKKYRMSTGISEIRQIWLFLLTSKVTAHGCFCRGSNIKLCVHFSIFLYCVCM